ncbi:MAG: WbqC family protein [Candidatus Jettenia sp. CY-1]|nr:MAG: WbqC family protein [Candidatus Jettenia sp. CY-1]
MECIVAIHQPNYLPWLGFFYKITQSNVFVFLDNVQYSIRTYQNRVQICLNKQPFWLTQPVRTRGYSRALTKEITFADLWWTRKHIKTIEHAYSKHPYFKEIKPLMELYSYETENQSEFNMKAISLICQLLGIETKLVIASQLDLPEVNNATERIINITKCLDGTTYLSGEGGKKYQDESLFEKAKIGIRYSDFVIKPYPQPGCLNFIPRLSIIDAICNIGKAGVSNILHQTFCT